MSFLALIPGNQFKRDAKKQFWNPRKKVANEHIHCIRCNQFPAYACTGPVHNSTSNFNYKTALPSGFVFS